MNVTRINEFRAKDGEDVNLYALLASFLPIITAADGCQSCQLLHNLDDPARLVIIEVWDSVAAHQAAAKKIPPQHVEKALELLACPPRGAYYILCGD
jgi:quinol monooxygenase YgiN